jgi:hypothetical protein
MPFSPDNQTLLYIIIGCFIAQFLIMRYYVQSTIEYDIHHNNKKLIKRMSDEIGTTFAHYLGGREYEEHSSRRPERHESKRRRHQKEEQMDSVEDPMEEEDEADE